MKRLVLGLAFAGLVLATAPAWGGTVYIPMEQRAGIDGQTFQTAIWISNSGAKARRFSTFEIGLEADGTDRPEDWLENLVYTGVGPTSTRVLTIGDSQPNGLLEVSGAPQLVYKARITDADGAGGIGAEVPVISSDNALAAGDTGSLQNWAKTPARTTHFTVVNLGREQSECVVEVFNPQGGQIGATATVIMDPLSMRRFPDVLGILGEGDISEVYAKTTCDQRFYVFSLTFNSVNGEVISSFPSQGTDSNFQPPGVEPPPPPCPAGGLCFVQDGLFHQPTAGNLVRRLEFPMTPGQVFSKISITLDVFHGGWFGPKQDGIHNFFWLARNRYRSNTFGYFNARGPGRDIVSNLTNVDLPAGVTSRPSVSVALIPGTQYRVEYTYDTGTFQVIATLRDESGAIVAQVVDIPTTNQIRTEGEGFIMDFGLTNVENDSPTIGWRYSNLNLQFIP